MTTRPDEPLSFDESDIARNPGVAWASGRPSFVVFAQGDRVRFDRASWAVQAERFFRTELSISPEKRYGASTPGVDAAWIRVAEGGRGGSERLVLVRPVSDDDRERAARARGGGGLELLARRCKTLVLVATAEPADRDRGALLVATLVASLVLGPIVSPDGTRIFGVKTGREMLEALASPSHG